MEEAVNATSTFIDNLMGELEQRKDDLKDELEDKFDEMQRDIEDEIDRDLNKTLDWMQNKTNDTMADLEDINFLGRIESGAMQTQDSSAYMYAAVSIGAAAVLAFVLKRNLKKPSVHEPLFADGDDLFNRA